MNPAEQMETQADHFSLAGKEAKSKTEKQYPGKNAETSYVSVTRWYGLEHQKNSTEYLPLPDEKFYCIKQIRTRYLVVSTQSQIEFLDVPTKSRVGKLDIGGFYSLLLRANLNSMSFEMEDVFLQESCIGFTNGAFFKTALICRLGSEGSPAQVGGDVEMVEESKSPVI